MGHKVRIYCYSPPMSGTIAMYRLPDNSMIYRPASDEGCIDLEPLRPHVGEQVEIWRDGSLECEVKLAAISEQEGVPCLIFQPELAI